MNGGDLSGLAGTLFVQCGPTDGQNAARIADRPGGGLVLTRRQRQSGEVMGVASFVKGQGFRGPLLVDANRYSGDSRVAATTPFNSDWISRQRDLGLPVLTDSGYIGEDDLRGLESIVGRAAVDAPQDGIALLPLHLSWLQPKGNLSVLIEHVATSPVPVAVVLESKQDPLAAQRVLRELPRLFACGPPVLLLRSDVSALGALCLGATAAAVGTRTSLRHLYPVSPDGGPRPSGEAAAVVAQCLSFFQLGKIARAVQADPDNQLWTCACATCVSRTMDWMAQQDEATAEQAAFAHSMEILLDLRDHLLDGSTPEQALASWRAHCVNAAAQCEQIKAGFQNWQVPRFLDSWIKVTAPSGAHQPAAGRQR